AVELANGAPRRQRWRHARRQVYEAQLIEHTLLGREVRRVPTEVAFDIGKTKERLRANVLQAGHADEARFERQRNVAFHFFRAPALRLRDDFDHRRHRVWVGLDGQNHVRAQADAEL